MAKTFAQIHWNDFERLAFELTKDCFGIVPTKLFRTQDTKDGGFDSVFIHELGKLGRTVIANETLMEAKLRSSHEAIGLRAFAATMIIAFNGRTNCLIVVTNREFSPQALQAARDFQWKSRLQVILATQKTLSAWVRPRLTELSERYPRDLLEDLILPSPTDEVCQEIQIPGSDIIGTEPPARISLGRLPDGTIAKSEIILMPVTGTTEIVRSVIGHKRRRIAYDLADVLSGDSGCAIVQGEAGSGKSHIVRAVLAVMQPNRRCLGLIDLSQTATSRHLFLATVAQLLGIEVAEAARQFTGSVAKTVFSTAVGIPIPQEVVNAVLAVLASSSGQAPRDVDQIHLTEYLSFIADRSRGGSRLLVFHNLDKATAEVLEFLHATIPRLTINDVSVLLEVAIGGDAPLVGSSQWRAHVEIFDRAAGLGRFLVPNLDLSEAVELLLEQLPGLGEDRAHAICKRIGNRALFLHHAGLWLKKRHVVSERAQGIHLVEDPEVFFEGIRPEASISILDRHIDIWRSDTDLPYADAISAAALLNGRLPVGAVQLLTPSHSRFESMLDALIATGLFVPEARLEGVRVSHSLLLERMQAIEHGRVPGYGARKFGRKRVASILLDGIDQLTTERLSRDLYRSALLAACERWPEAWKSAQSSGQALEEEHQLALAAEALSRAVEVAEHMVAEGDSRGALWRIYSLVGFLRVEDERYRLGLYDNERRLEALTVAIRLTEFLDREVGSQEIRLRTRYLSWRAAFTREKFDEALSIARDLFDQVCDLHDVDPEIAGSAVAALGITLKAMEQEDESKFVFDRGESLFPTSACCRAQRWANIAAFALRTDPARSLHYFRRIVDAASSGLTLQGRIHVEVDIAMALFLMGCSEEASLQATQAINLADANGIPAEAARGRNILGCLFWRDERPSDAMSLFERAILDAERSYMERFLWRFRVNLASVSATVDPATALANARWAEDRLLMARASRLNELAATPTYSTSRWYVALLAIGLVYSKCEAAEDMARLHRRLMPLPSFRLHLESLIQHTFPPAVFAGTTHLQGKNVMITG